MTRIPESTKSSLRGRLATHARQHWPSLTNIDVRFRANFAYVDAERDGITAQLFRLRYGGSASRWGFAIWRASHDDYEDSVLPNGLRAGTPEEALDCAAFLYA